MKFEQIVAAFDVPHGGWTTCAEVAETLGLTPRKVRDTIRNARERGLIETKPGPTNGEAGGVPQYHRLIKTDTPPAPETVRPLSEEPEFQNMGLLARLNRLEQRVEQILERQTDILRLLS